MVKIAQRVLSEALELPDADRLAIASQLLSSVSPDFADIPDEQWLDELHRRRDEFLADPSSGTSWEELKAEAGDS